MSADNDLVSFVVTLPDGVDEDLDRLNVYIGVHGNVKRLFKLTKSLSAQLAKSLFDNLRANFPSARIDLDDPGALEQFRR